tara:strand:+ start:373 stop:546 length:174 start_codon:yes stop_codon:yes gene_type:complete
MAWTIPQRIELGELAELANFREVVKQTAVGAGGKVVVVVVREAVCNSVLGYTGAGAF